MWGRSRASVHHMQEAAGGARRAAFFIPSGSGGDLIAEGQQAVGKVHVLKLHVGRLAGQLHVGKVPEPPDAQADKPVSRALGHRVGHGQHRHVRPVGADEPLQLRHVQDRRPRHLGADEGGGDVKGGLQPEARLPKAEILHQRVAQIAHAHNNNAVAAVHPQDMPDLTAQLVYIIPVSLLAELAEAAQVLADLGGRDAHFFPKGAGGNADRTLQMQVIQVAVIAGKAANDGVGYILFFHTSL